MNSPPVREVFGFGGDELAPKSAAAVPAMLLELTDPLLAALLEPIDDCGDDSALVRLA